MANALAQLLATVPVAKLVKFAPLLKRRPGDITRGDIASIMSVFGVDPGKVSEPTLAALHALFQGQDVDTVADLFGTDENVEKVVSLLTQARSGDREAEAMKAIEALEPVTRCPNCLTWHTFHQRKTP